MEIVIIVMLGLLLISALVGLIVVTRALFLMREDMQVMLKAMSIDVGHNKRTADNIEKIAKLSG